MAKKPTPAAKTAAAPAPAPAATETKAAPAAAPAKEAKVPLAKMRGPRGVAETAKITVKYEGNPKRPSSKAHAVFALYKTGMTVGEFCDAVDATENKGLATIAMTYDASHGFIEIEGYTPPVVHEPKPKKEPKPKAEKKAPAAKADPAAKAKADAAAQEEVVD